MIGCIAIIFTMSASTMYHQFSAISKHLEDLLLRIDLIGIAIMIFVMALALMYQGFHTNHTVRNSAMGLMILIAICNGVLSVLPCYA